MNVDFLSIRACRKSSCKPFKITINFKKPVVEVKCFIVLANNYCYVNVRVTKRKCCEKSFSKSSMKCLDKQGKIVSKIAFISAFY